MPSGPSVQAYIVAVKFVQLVCGGLLTVLAVRAYRRTGSGALRALAVGLGLVTLGAVFAGAVHQLTSLGIQAGIAIESTFTAIGFAILAYSLYADSGGGRGFFRPADGRRSHGD